MGSSHGISRFRLSLFQVVAIGILGKVSDYIQNGFLNRTLSLLISNTILAILGYRRISQSNVSFRSWQNIAFLTALLATLGLRYAYNTHRYLNGIPLYESPQLLLIYNGLKPVILAFCGYLPDVYKSLTVGHLLTTVLFILFECEPITDYSFSKITYYVLPSVCLTYLLQQLEVAFTYDLLLPEVFYFIQACFNVLFSLIELILRPESVCGKIALSQIVAYVSMELATIVIASATHAVRFTKDREHRLVAFDNTFSNFLEAFTTALILISLFNKTLSTTVPGHFDIGYARQLFRRLASICAIANAYFFLYLAEAVYSDIVQI